MSAALIALWISLPTALFGQSVYGSGADAPSCANETTRSQLQEISVTRFEDPRYWSVYAPIENANTVHTRLADVANDEIDQLQSAEEGGFLAYQPTDEYVLGIRADFMRRGFLDIEIDLSRPIAIPGITCQISVWVAGRNWRHDLFLVIKDVHGERKELRVGTMRFRGWRKMAVDIPPYEENRDQGLVRGVRQHDPHFPYQTGIEIVGFIIRPYFVETIGSYYVYFDDMRALTDLAVITTENITDDGPNDLIW